MFLKKVRFVHFWLLLCFIKTFFDTSNIIPYPDMIDDSISIILFLLFIVLMMNKKYSFRTLVLCIMVSAMSVYSALASGYMIIATSVLMIFALEQEPLKETACFLFKIKYHAIIVHTVIAFLLFALGLTDIGGYYESGTRFRLHFGYGWPGHFADYVLDLMILWIWIHYTEIKRQDYIKLFFIAILTYLCTNSRLVFVDSIILVFLTWMINYTHKLDWVIEKIAQFIIPMLTVFMLVMISLFAQGDRIAYAMDSILNTRIRLNGYRLEQYGITWFGQNCPLVSNGMNWRWISTGGAFDCTYMWLIINMGIILLLTLMIGFYKLAKQESVFISLLLIIWALGALIDTDFLNGMCSFPILFMSLLLKSGKKRIQVKSYTSTNTEIPC